MKKFPISYILILYSWYVIWSKIFGKNICLIISIYIYVYMYIVYIFFLLHDDNLFSFNPSIMMQ